MKKPMFGNAVICDNATIQDSGKINVNGIFSTIWAWAYPAQRNWSIVFTIFDMPQIETELEILIQKGNKILIKSIPSKIKKRSYDKDFTYSTPFELSFLTDGFYKIVCRLTEFNVITEIPFRVRTKKWPVFDLEKINSLYPDNVNKSSVISLSVECGNCNQLYTFEDSIHPEHTMKEGVLLFPEDGEFHCTKCNTIIHLRDLQGQIRESILEYGKKNKRVPKNV